MRFTLFGAIVCLAGPASAGCIVDEKMAAQGFRVIAFTRVCPEYRAADDKNAMNILVATEAVDQAEEHETSCLAMVAFRSGYETGRLMMGPAPAREAECAMAKKAVADDKNLRGMLDIFGLLRPEAKKP